MVFHSKLSLAVCAILVVASSSATLRGQPTVQAATKVPTKAAAAPAKAAVVQPKGKSTAAAPKVAAPVKAKAPSDADSLEALGNGLKIINNLRAVFTKKEDKLQDGAEKFANGAMSEELSNKDSQVWSTIETMIAATQKAKAEMKGKSKEDREKAMKSLEADLDKKATVLSNVNNDVSKKQRQQDEEYVLGLLLLHKDNWSMDKQLDALQKFMHNSPVMQDLFKHHDSSKPLAGQLAVMLDAQPKDGAVKVPTVDAKKPTAKKHLAKATTAAAKTMFIQLTDSIMNRDCPYCAAQCVDKCHQAGKPYVQCMTDCADAGK